MELILLAPLMALFVGVSGGVIRSMTIRGVTSRKFSADPELSAPEPSKMVGTGSYQAAIEAAPAPIPKEVRDEIEKNQDWFDSEMHRTLKAAGAPVIARVMTDIEQVLDPRGNVVAEFGGVERVALKGCVCEQCVEVLRLSPGYKKITQASVVEVDILDDSE